MSRLTRDGTAEPVSRDQILRHARGQGNIIFPVQLTTSRIGNLTPVDPHSAICDNHTYIHTYISVLCGRDQKERSSNESIHADAWHRTRANNRVILSQTQAFSDRGYSWKRWGAGSGNRSRCHDAVIYLYSRDFARRYQHGPQSSK